jgi:hypothetical protein
MPVERARRASSARSTRGRRVPAAGRRECLETEVRRALRGMSIGHEPVVCVRQEQPDMGTGLQACRASGLGAARAPDLDRGFATVTPGRREPPFRWSGSDSKPNSRNQRRIADCELQISAGPAQNRLDDPLQPDCVGGIGEPGSTVPRQLDQPRHSIVRAFGCRRRPQRSTANPPGRTPLRSARKSEATAPTPGPARRPAGRPGTRGSA